MPTFPDLKTVKDGQCAKPFDLRQFCEREQRRTKRLVNAAGSSGWTRGFFQTMNDAERTDWVKGAVEDALMWSAVRR